MDSHLAGRTMPVHRDINRNETRVDSRHTFMDLFAGCGGLSLGLMMAGWNGLLAVEKDSLAFETLKFNLIDDGHSYAYDWPAWFEKKHCSIGRFVGRYRDQIKSLNGKVTLIAGGPPCQSFSLAGRRDKTDPRNHLFKAYVDIVSLVRPKILLLENVHGIAIAFDKKERSCNRKPGRRPKPYSVKIKEALEEIGYRVYPGLIRAVDHGVPQFRPRYIMFGIDASLIPEGAALEPFSMLDAQRKEFLGAKGLPVERPVTTREAISDLETAHIQLVDCVDCPGFRQIAYTGPSTFYQQFLHGNLNGVAPNSLRLANHRKETVERFRQILSTCRHGVQLSKEDRERFGLKKHCTVPLDGDKPCHTLTTLPDDLLHYAEPRILTVREFARLQSFPDWFQFKGKYTTGGDRRVKECPRYTQVGNAVPPLLAEALGRTLTELLCRLVPSPSIRGRRAKHGMVGNGSR